MMSAVHTAFGLTPYSHCPIHLPYGHMDGPKEGNVLTCVVAFGRLSFLYISLGDVKVVEDGL